MVVDLNVQNLSFNTQSSSYSSAQSSAQASGTLMGHNVSMVNDPMSLLANCAEELTFAVDTTDEFELEERKEKESIDLKDSELIKRYQEILQSGDKAQKFDDMKNAIKLLKGMQNAQTLLQLARDLAENSGEAYALLQESYESFKKDNASPALLQSIEEAINTLELHEKGKIVTDIQVELTRQEDACFAHIGDGADLYTRSVSEFTSLQEVYTYIRDKHKDDLDTALDFLYKLLGNDLASDVCSMEKSKLESVSTSLGELRSFQSAHALCDKFVDRLASVHSIESFPHDGFTTLGEILNIKKETYISSSSIERLMRAAKPANPEEEVMFLQELQTTVRHFSATLFDSDQERVKFTEAVQTAVDEAVNREDEWLLSFE